MGINVRPFGEWNRSHFTHEAQDAINQALRLLGVHAEGGKDEFDTAWLGQGIERWKAGLMRGPPVSG